MTPVDQGTVNRSPSTEVFHLATGEWLTMPMPAAQAVRAAHLLFTVRNRNTWTWDLSQLGIAVGRWTVACGDFCAVERPMP